MASERQSRVRQISLVLSLLSTTYSPAFAEPALTELEIKPVTITINRFDDSYELNFVNVETITAEQISQSTARTLPELLSAELGIFTTQEFFGNSGNSAKIDLRGFGAVADENTLILLDGVRVKNNDFSSVNWALMPLSLVERVEVVRGGGSVLFGAGTAAGAVNIVTKGPFREQGHARIFTSGGSFGTRSVGVSGTATSDNAGVSVYGERYNSDNYRENNEERRTVSQVDYRWFGDQTRIILKASTSDQDLRLPGDLLIEPDEGLDETIPERRATTDPNDFSTLKTDRAIAQLSLDRENAQFSFEVGYRKNQSTGFFEDTPSFSNTELDVWNLSPRAQLFMNLFNVDNAVEFGVDYYEWTLDTRVAQGLNVRPLNTTNFAQEDLGYYFRDTVKLTDKWTVSAGWRQQRHEISGTDRVDLTAPGAFAFGFQVGSAAPAARETFRESLYDLATKYQFSKERYLKLGTNRSVRFANADEVGFTGAELDPVTFTRVFDFLRPQVSHTHEILLGHASQVVDATIGVFQIDTKDEIRLDPFFDSLGNTNFPQTKRKGFEAAVAYQGDSSKVGLRYVFTQARFTTGVLPGIAFNPGLGVTRRDVENVSLEGKTVPLVPEHRVNLTGTVKLREGYDLSMSASYFSDQFMENDEGNTFGRKIPAYSIINAKLSKSHGGWFFSLGINNLFDREYFSYAVASNINDTRAAVYPQPGRSALLSMEYMFGN